MNIANLKKELKHEVIYLRSIKPKWFQIWLIPSYHIKKKDSEKRLRILFYKIAKTIADEIIMREILRSEVQK